MTYDVYIRRVHDEQDLSQPLNPRARVQRYEDVRVGIAWSIGSSDIALELNALPLDGKLELRAKR